VASTGNDQLKWMNEGSGRVSKMKKEGRKNYRRLKNERTKENENSRRQGQDGIP